MYNLYNNNVNENGDDIDYDKHTGSCIDCIVQKKPFYLASISEKEVEKEIMTIPNNKSHGLYSYPVKIIKLAKCLLSKPLTLTQVTPVFKDDDDTDPNNYRPVSLLSIFNRI